MLPTLFCLKGRDSGARFSLITLAAVAIFFVVNSLTVHASSGTRAAAALVLGALACTLTGLSARRRLADTGRPLNWAVGPASFMALLVMFQVVMPFSVWLLLPLVAVVFTTAALANWQSKDAKSAAKGHPMGYAGPRSAPVMVPQRVEPSLDGKGGASTPVQKSVTAQQVEHSYWDDEPSRPTFALGDMLKRVKAPTLTQGSDPTRTQKPAISNKVVLQGGGAFAAVILALVAWMYWPAADTGAGEETVVSQEKPTATEPAVKPAETFDHRLVMPDTYELLLHGKTLAISWPGDPAAHGVLWEQLSAEGDQSCETIRFNNGTSYRSIRVTVGGNDQYLAYFSALDTAGIVNDVAMRGRFELCGYTFSLKGSMAQLESSPAFSRWL